MTRPADPLFISYSHHPADTAYVESLAAVLLATGVPAWFDRKIGIGARWEHVIRDRLDSCPAMIVVMTPEAEDSAWVGREISRAEALSKPILPLLLRGGHPFFRLGDLKFADVRGGFAPTAAFAAEIERSRRHQP